MYIYTQHYTSVDNACLYWIRPTVMVFKVWYIFLSLDTERYIINVLAAATI